MLWFTKLPNSHERIARTGFLTSLIAYGFFGLAEYLRPGFVSHYLSIHWFLGAAVAFGGWWAAAAKVAKDRYILEHVVAALLGIPMFVVSWQFGGGLAEYRPLFALLSATVSLIILRLLRS